ncbi:hypothetical protein CGLAMM_05285 [Acetobacteraceae bacterium EV16G]|uniref:AFG1-like ATPase n=2 Tax=Sorlinia euscelidii TaxID=3081148 RepID=A0ABU7U2F2_9PROT
MHNGATPTPCGLKALYREALASGRLEPDAAQEECVDVLDAFGRDATQQTSHSTLGLRVTIRRRAIRSAPGRGLYLLGEVGRGKTMLMDLFFDSLDFRQKRRVHFHEFMQEILKALNSPQLRQKRYDDPLAELAWRIALHNRVLCFDEFQLNDMSDAVVNLRIIDLLLTAGVHIVMTSNTHPDALLQHNRQAQTTIRPLITRIMAHVRVITLAAQRDYRRARDMAENAWRVPPDAESREIFSRIFREVSPSEPSRAQLQIGSRQFPIACSGDGVARCQFTELCSVMSGTAEFIALAARYPVVMIESIPQLSPDRYDEALRFIRLIDVLYENGTRLYASSDVWPKDLYPAGENVTAFQRTISRLEEMRSRSWHDRPGISMSQG